MSELNIFAWGTIKLQHGRHKGKTYFQIAVQHKEYCEHIEKLKVRTEEEQDQYDYLIIQGRLATL